jgi:hypothetical protein
MWSTVIMESAQSGFGGLPEGVFSEAETVLPMGDPIE